MQTTIVISPIKPPVIEANFNPVPINGLSAYQLAVRNGFTGTEEEWTNYFLYESLIIPLGFPNEDAELKTDEKTLGNYFPFNFYIQDIILTLTDPPTGSNFIVDIKVNSLSIFNTLINVDLNTNSSINSLTPYSLNSNTINEGDVVSFDIVQVGAINPGQYPVLVIKGVYV